MSPVKTIESSFGSTAYLLLEAAPTNLALRAASVLAIAHTPPLDGKNPLPLHTFMPIHYAAPAPFWVLSLGDVTQTTMISFTGNARIEHLPVSALLAMPHVSRAGFEMFSDLVLVNERPVALLVNVDALIRAHQELG